MKTVILAGGRGQRLKSVVDDRPKPMAEINDRPFLEYLILQLKRWHLTDIILSIGYKGEIIKKHFGDGSKWSVSIQYSEEVEPLGTGGAIGHAKELIETDFFIVINGDSFLELDYSEFIRFHKTNNGIATIALTEVDDVSRFGTVSFEEGYRIKSFNEKCSAGRGYINGGIYCFQKEILDHIPERNVSLEREVFPKLLAYGVYGFKTEGFFMDIGTPESYEIAKGQLVTYIS